MKGPSYLRLALFIGLIASAVELAVIAVKRGVFGELAFVGRHVWWTAPLVNVAFFGALGAAVAIAARLRPAPWWWSVCAWLALFGGLLGVLLDFPQLYRSAVVILAAGVATRVATMNAMRNRGLAELSFRAVPWMLAAVAVTAGGSLAWQAYRETRAINAHPSPPSGSPNVLLIVLDTVRAASTSLHGYERDTTPFLKKRASQGVLFTHAFSPAPWTLPSHASMLTGLWAPEMTADWSVPLRGDPPTITEALAARGYATGGFAANLDYVTEETGITGGFARFDDYVLKPGLMLRSAGLGRSLGRNRMLRRFIGAEGTLGRRFAPEISGTFLEWVDGLPQGRSWFALLNYYDAHRPFQPPEPYFSRFASPEVQPDPRLDMFNDPENPWNATDAARFAAAYDGSISYLDAQLEALFESLDRRGVLKNTIVIVTSDHGEEFGERGFWDHGNTLYLRSVHVPLIVLAPGRVQPGVIDHAVSTRDIPATIVDLLADVQPAALPGNSLARHWRGTGTDDELLVIGVRQSPGHPDSYPVTSGDLLGLVRGRLRYIVNESTGAEELFDYQADPFEKRNLAGDPEYASALARFREDSRSHRHVSKTP